MESGINLTGYDFVVIGLFLLFVFRGIWLGFLRQVTGLLALFVSYFVAGQYHDRLFPFLKEVSTNPTVIFVASVVILFLVTYIVTLLLGKALSKVIEVVFSKWFDKSLGGLLGVIMGVTVVILLHMILSSVVAPESTMLRDCKTCAPLGQAADFTRGFIADEKVRKSLMQQSPAISVDDVIDMFKDHGKKEERPPSKDESTTVKKSQTSG